MTTNHAPARPPPPPSPPQKRETTKNRMCKVFSKANNIRKILLLISQGVKSNSWKYRKFEVTFGSSRGVNMVQDCCIQKCYSQLQITDVSALMTLKITVWKDYTGWNWNKGHLKTAPNIHLDSVSLLYFCTVLLYWTFKLSQIDTKIHIKLKKIL